MKCWNKTPTLNLLRGDCLFSKLFFLLVFLIFPELFFSFSSDSEIVLFYLIFCFNVFLIFFFLCSSSLSMIHLLSACYSSSYLVTSFFLSSRVINCPCFSFCCLYRNPSCCHLLMLPCCLPKELQYTLDDERVRAESKIAELTQTRLDLQKEIAEKTQHIESIT